MLLVHFQAEICATFVTGLMINSYFYSTFDSFKNDNKSPVGKTRGHCPHDFLARGGDRPHGVGTYDTVDDYHRQHPAFTNPALAIPKATTETEERLPANYYLCRAGNVIIFSVHLSVCRKDKQKIYEWIFSGEVGCNQRN